MNPLMNLIQSNQPQNAQSGGFNMQSLMKFANQYGNNPDLAKQEVEKMLQSGEMSQEQFNGMKDQVSQIMSMFGK